MSGHDPHWAIKKTHEGDGNPSDAHIDPEQFRQHQSAKFLLQSPRARVQYLEQLDSLIGSDDATLRSRAELLELRREMLRTHNQSLALKR
jgi:DnaJ-domain-containing protein 1